MKRTKSILGLILLIGLIACNDSEDLHVGHNQEVTKNESGDHTSEKQDLEFLLRPTNEFVISAIPFTTVQKMEQPIEVGALGSIAYDTRQTGSISARVSGRIVKLYVKYRYQRIKKTQHILDIYSPEFLTEQQNLLFLLKNDAGNLTMIHAAKERLRLLGVSEFQINNITQTRRPSFTIAVHSNYSGHIHETGEIGSMNNKQDLMKDVSLITRELSLREGMYVQKGQTILNVYDPERAWALLNIYDESQDLVKVGNVVRIMPETTPTKYFNATINFIEPFYRKEGKTLTARSYFNNSLLKIPIGSQVRATIVSNTKVGYWLPKDAVISLGLNKVVFKKSNGSMKAHKIYTGIIDKNHIQVLSGLNETDSVAINAQYLIDSESLIKVKN